MKLHDTGYFPNFQSQTNTLTTLLLLRFKMARGSCLRGSTRYFLMCERHEKRTVSDNTPGLLSSYSHPRTADNKAVNTAAGGLGQELHEH